ncbi:MAG: DUF2254 family protein [Candidatus Dormiibacterota bacterium]
MAVLPAGRALPHPFAPVAMVTVTTVLALISVDWLISFINHISQSIRVNHIIDRIARETELVIDEIMPYRRSAWRPTTRSICVSDCRSLPSNNIKIAYDYCHTRCEQKLNYCQYRSEAIDRCIHRLATCRARC